MICAAHTRARSGSARCASECAPSLAGLVPTALGTPLTCPSSPDTQNCQPVGAGGQEGSGRHPAGGSQPGGGTGHPGAALNLIPTPPPTARPSPHAKHGPSRHRKTRDRWQQANSILDPRRPRRGPTASEPRDPEAAPATQNTTVSAARCALDVGVLAGALVWSGYRLPGLFRRTSWRRTAKSRPSAFS